MSAFDVAGQAGYLVLPAAVAIESAGVPVPGEATLIAAAVLAAHGHMQLPLVLALAAVGAIAGDNLGYLLGRRLGGPALAARGPGRRLRLRALRAASALFARYGGAAVFAGRFVGIGRIAIAWLAGADRMRWTRFAAWNAAGSTAWAATVGGSAYALGAAGAHWIALAGVAITCAALAHLWWTDRPREPAAAHRRLIGRRNRPKPLMHTLPSSVRGCLFDLDGVLTATNELHRKAWSRVLDSLLLDRGQRPFNPNTDFDRYINGRARADGVRTFLTARGIAADDALVAEIAAQKNDELLRLLRDDGVQAYPGSIRFVVAARDAGLRTAVVSSSANAEAVLRAASIDHLFDARVDGVDVEQRHLRGKPAPDAFLAGADAIGVKPDEAAVFEDALAGVEAGRAGHFRLVVGVDRVGHAAELSEHGADVVVQDLSELLA